MKKKFLKNKISKFFILSSIPLILVGCSKFSAVGTCYFDDRLDNLSDWNKFKTNLSDGIVTKDKSKMEKDKYTGILFVGATYCPFCHSMLDLDPDAYKSMKNYWDKYASDDETKLQSWFDKNTEKWYGSLNQAVHAMKEILPEKEPQINYKAYYIDIYLGKDHKIGQPITSGDNDHPNQWTLGLPPQYNFVGEIVDYVAENDKDLYYKFVNDGLKKTNNYDYGIPIIIYFDQGVIIGFSAGYLDYDASFSAINQMLNV
ncbi:hypothetical protein JTY60_01490 [symbiont of Argiope bruennichi]|uniref:hypothetical protein n=1 Tax=symbiont of Argiope bruennichi TaxID=2810479 RepID=UPI003DA60DBF